MSDGGLLGQVLGGRRTSDTGVGSGSHFDGAHVVGKGNGDLLLGVEEDLEIGK